MLPESSRRLLLWSAMLLGLAVLVLLALNSVPRRYKVNPTFNLAYDARDGSVRLEVRNATATEVERVQVFIQSKPNPLVPIGKLTWRPAENGNYSDPVEVPVDSPLTLRRYESAFFMLTPALAERDVTVIFVADGEQRSEIHRGLNRE